jgi:hypothetical protein
MIKQINVGDLLKSTDGVGFLVIETTTTGDASVLLSENGRTVANAHGYYHSVFAEKFIDRGELSEGGM